MTSPVESRFRRLQALFDAALELPDGEQDDYARTACGDDTALRDELLRLIARQRAQHLLSDTPLLEAIDPALREASPRLPTDPERAGPFRIVAPIGNGGMGRVYHAVRDDGDVHQDVAIKLVRGDLLNPALLTRFSIERRLLATLQHPNICRFLDAGTLPDGTPYVAMERVQGAALIEYCDSHALPLPERVRLLRRIASAVAYAHRQLIVHRDIKSSNVLVDGDGEPKLLDFGIAKSLADSGDLTHTATAERFITPFNAAPEQVRGEATGVGCDIYAFGLLAYEVLCGAPAFDFTGLRAGEIERLICTVPPPSMSTRAAAGGPAAAQARALPDARALARALAGDLDAVVSTCLRKAVDDRYASIEQLDADLEHWLAHRPVRARGGDSWYRARKFVERNRLPVALTSLAVATLIGAAGIVGWQSLRLADERNRVVQERDRAQQVVALLQDAFVSADPTRVSGGSVTAQQVLQAARPRIEALFDTRPDLYATLAATVASVELGLSLDAEASQLAARGIAAASRTQVDPDALRTLHRVAAEAAMATGDFAAAQHALDDLRALDPVEQPDWLVVQGRLLHRQQSNEDAMAVLRRALDALATRGPDDDLATRARLEYVQARRQSGDDAGALDMIDRTIAWQRTGLPPGHALLALSQLRRVDLLRQTGRTQEAIDEGLRMHRDMLTAYGDSSAMSARSIAAVGMAQSDGGQEDASIESYVQARDIWTRALGETHPHTIRANFNLANMLTRKPARDAETLALYEQALQAARLRYGPTSNITAYMRLGLALFLASRAQWERMLDLLSSPEARASVADVIDANRDEHKRLLRDGIAAACSDASSTCDNARTLLAILDASQPAATP